MSSSGSVYAWCGCREQVTGRRLGARCPQRGSEGHGSWYLSLELPPGPDARRRRIRRGGFSARADAQRALARLQMPVAGDHAPPVTVGQWLQLWLASREGPRPSTLRGYAAHVRLYLVPYLGQILLADLSAAHVQAMFTAIARQHAAAGTPIAPATLARVKATLRAALNAAIRPATSPSTRPLVPSCPRPAARGPWSGPAPGSSSGSGPGSALRSRFGHQRRPRLS